MSNPNFKLDDSSPTVSWADPRNSDSSTSSQVAYVKAVYVKNLPKSVTQDQLKELFERHGKITKVVLPPAKPGQENSRYGFVHFAERSSAMKALKNTERYEIDGLCTLQPLAYGRGATPAGMAMMPLLLPDGRIGYVL
nr:heterogeneous nuclear ribonucleoprotein R [Ipomoea batatas]